MGLSLVTPPTSDPISLAEAKAHCRITSDEEDGLIASYILAARQLVENDTHKRMLTQTLDYTIDHDWPYSSCYGPRIEFPIGPVQSVVSISYVDSSGMPQTLATSEYVAANMGSAVQSGYPYIEPAYGITWPVVRCQPAAITVRFVAGWTLSDVPNPLMQAMRLLLSHVNENREAVASGSFMEVPLGLEFLLSAYRDRRF